MNEQPPVSPAHAAPRHACWTINRSDDFETTLHLTEIRCLPGQSELKITSRWLGAKDPKAEQVRFQAIVRNEHLKGLAFTLLPNASQP